MKSFRILFLVIVCHGLLLSQDKSDLARKTQNPVGDLISVPFQNNTNFGIGPDGRTQNILNIQPVWPLHLNEEWNLITRTIAPIVTQPDFAMPSGSTTGLGDITFTAFLAPAKSEGIIWGAGPVLMIPTGKTGIGLKKWGLGPSAVFLKMTGPWVLGILVNNIWSIAGESSATDVNLMLVQYFINYNLADGLYLSSAPIITANWEAATAERWVVPFGGGVGKIFKLGRLPLNAAAHAYVNAVKPDTFGADWTLRLQIQLLFPA